MTGPIVSAAPNLLVVDWIGTVVPWFGKPPYPGALEVLERFRAAGATLAVVSSAEQGHIEDEVARVGLQADEVLGTRDKSTAMSRLRLCYGGGLVLGDHPADLEAAQAAGLEFVQARLEGQPGLTGRSGAFESWDELSIEPD